MRFSTVASAAVAAAPALVVAQGGSLGFAIGTKKPDGSCKYTADYEADLDALNTASGSKIVRTYSASDCNSIQNLLPAASHKGFQVLPGIWHTAVDQDVAAIQSVLQGNEGALYGVTVGSEALYRGDLDGNQLLDLINNVKGRFPPGTKVGTADSWNKYADGTANPLLTGGVNLLLVNAFGFWQGQEIGNATHTFFDDIDQAFQHIQESGSQAELWVGETGWPTDGGSNYGAAIAGTQNAETYYNEGLCAIVQWGVNAFYFEAFDEPWKPDSKGDTGALSDEKHWGAMNADRTPKWDLHC